MMLTGRRWKSSLKWNERLECHRVRVAGQREAGGDPHAQCSRGVESRTPVLQTFQGQQRDSQQLGGEGEHPEGQRAASSRLPAPQ